MSIRGGKQLQFGVPDSGTVVLTFTAVCKSPVPAAYDDAQHYPSNIMLEIHVIGAQVTPAQGMVMCSSLTGTKSVARQVIVKTALPGTYAATVTAWLYGAKIPPGGTGTLSNVTLVAEK